jgi:hypothetical protein
MTETIPIKKQIGLPLSMTLVARLLKALSWSGCSWKSKLADLTVYIR